MSKSKGKQQQQPKWLIPAVIIGALVIVFAIFASIISNRRAAFVPEVTGAPRAKVEQTRIDHGTVRFEQPVTSVFRIRNVGDQPLTILGEPRVELVQGC